MKNKIIAFIKEEIRSTRLAIFTGNIPKEEMAYGERVSRYLEFFLIPEIEKINE